MSKVEIISEIDTKGRVIIPKGIRDKYGLKPKDKVRLKVLESMPRLSFIKECEGILEGGGDAVELMHKKSSFRF